MIVTFIGGGNMAAALISGLQSSGNSQLEVRVADPSEAARNRMKAEFGAAVFADNGPAVEGADVIVLAVKPQIMSQVLASLTHQVHSNQLVISIAAGAAVDSIESGLGARQAVVRSMPNTPALIGHGITGLFAGNHCRPHHKEQAEKIMAVVGEVVWIGDERLMDVVTAVSGSGPAYYFLLTEALAEAGQALGLPPEIAAKLATHTARGAGIMASDSEIDVRELRQRVTSPGGTTQAAIEVLEAGGLPQLVQKAVSAATKRGRELL